MGDVKRLFQVLQLSIWYILGDVYHPFLTTTNFYLATHYYKILEHCGHFSVKTTNHLRISYQAKKQTYAEQAKSSAGVKNYKLLPFFLEVNLLWRWHVTYHQCLDDRFQSFPSS